MGWLSPTNGMVTRATDICGVSMSQTLIRKDSNYDDQMSGFNCFNLFFNLFKYIWADFLKPSTRHNQTGSEWLFFQTIRLGIFGCLSPQQTHHFFGESSQLFPERFPEPGQEVAYSAHRWPAPEYHPAGGSYEKSRAGIILVRLVVTIAIYPAW